MVNGSAKEKLSLEAVITIVLFSYGHSLASLHLPGTDTAAEEVMDGGMRYRKVYN